MAAATGTDPSTGGRSDVREALADQHAELEAMLDAAADEAWARPSRCPGWSVADVVLHLAQTDELAVASAEGRFEEGFAAFVEGLPPTADVDEGAGLAVDRDRGAPPAEVLARWRAGAAALRQAVEAGDAHRRVTWVAGDMTVTTLATTRLTECWIHAEDVAGALGVDLAPTDRLWHTARLTWRTLPYAFARAGRSAPGGVRFELESPSGATWTFAPDGPAPTTVRGPAVDLCRVAGQRAAATHTALVAEGPDAAAVLELVRTFA